MDDLNILLVDDEPDLLEQATIFLGREGNGFNIETTTSAEEGLEKLQEKSYDAIVSDYQMPSMNGLEFLKTLRKDWNMDIPFIIFTGRGREEVAIEALNIGADRYLQKGGRPQSQYEVLSKAIKQEVKRWRGEEKLQQREERLKAIFDASEEIIYTKDKEGRYTQANKAFSKKFDKSIGEIVGKKDEDIFPEEQGRELRREDKKVLDSGESNRSLDELTIKGKKYFFETTKVPLKDRNGEVTGLCGFARDITDLRKAEERFRRFFKSLGDAVFVTKVGGENKGKILKVNPAAEEQTGYSRDELIGMNIIEDLASGESKVTSQKQVDERLSDGETVTFMQRKQKKNGNKYWTDVVATPIEYKGKKASLSINRDITERKRMEDRLMHLFETAPDAILLMDKEKIIEGINEEFKEKVGYNRKEVIGEKLSEAPFIPEENRDDMKEKIEKRIRIKEKEYSPFTVEFQRKDKGTLFVEINVSTLTKDNKTIGALAIARDITSQRKMEKELQKEKAELRSLLRGSDDSIYMVDKNCRYVLVNDELLSRLDKKREEVIGSKFQEFHSEEESKEFSKKVNEVFETKKSLRQEHGWGEGRKKFLRTFSPVKNPETGAVTNVAIISKNITERVRAQEREEFLHSLLRHNLFNKTKVVQGYHELIQETELSEEQAEYIGRAIECNRKSAELIDEVRTLRKVSEAEVKEVNISPILEETIRELEKLALENDIEITCEKKKCKVKGGPLLKELFSNLIENSIKHSDGNMVKVSTRNEGGEIIISVEDDGVGIPDEDKEIIFERGFKGEASDGSGIGLNLAKEIAQSYRGTVKAKNSSLGGSQIEVRLEKV